MVAKVCSDDDLIAAVLKYGPDRAATILGYSSKRQIYSRMNRIEERRGINLRTSPKSIKNGPSVAGAVIPIEVRNGTVLVGSDAHIWPGDLTTAQRAFLHFAKELKPAAIIANGDFFDGSSISRFPSIGWESKPSVQEELEAVQDYMHQLVQASKNSQRLWPAGNHDLRFESRIAAQLPELRDVKGVHLKDHFPAWAPCWRVDINGGSVVVKHRWKGGIHATHNNTLNSGVTLVTGHLHSLKVTPYTDYNGTRYGVDTGTLADVNGEQFIHYTEAGPVNWRSGFVVLTFKDGELLLPELVQKWDEDHVQFRGQIIEC